MILKVGDYFLNDNTFLNKIVSINKYTIFADYISGQPLWYTNKGMVGSLNRYLTSTPTPLYKLIAFISDREINNEQVIYFIRQMLLDHLQKEP